jgi:hypothetical protein
VLIGKPRVIIVYQLSHHAEEFIKRENITTEALMRE